MPEKSSLWESELEEFAELHDEDCGCNSSESYPDECDCETMRRLKDFIKNVISQELSRKTKEFQEEKVEASTINFNCGCFISIFKTGGVWRRAMSCCKYHEHPNAEVDHFELCAPCMPSSGWSSESLHRSNTDQILSLREKLKKVSDELNRQTKALIIMDKTNTKLIADVNQENSSLREKMKGMVDVIDLCAAWIKKAHHHDGCVRRYQPYPQRKNRDICDCRRVYILGEIEALSHAEEKK